MSQHILSPYSKMHCRRRQACSLAPLQAAGTLHSMHSRQPMHRPRLHTMGTLTRCGRCSLPVSQMTSRSGSSITCCASSLGMRSAEALGGSCYPALTCAGIISSTGTSSRRGCPQQGAILGTTLSLLCTEAAKDKYMHSCTSLADCMCACKGLPADELAALPHRSESMPVAAAVGL